MSLGHSHLSLQTPLPAFSDKHLSCSLKEIRRFCVYMGRFPPFRKVEVHARTSPFTPTGTTRQMRWLRLACEPIKTSTSLPIPQTRHWWATSVTMERAALPVWGFCVRNPHCSQHGAKSDTFNLQLRTNLIIASYLVTAPAKPTLQFIRTPDNLLQTLMMVTPTQSIYPDDFAPEAPQPLRVLRGPVVTPK